MNIKTTIRYLSLCRTALFFMTLMCCSVSYSQSSGIVFSWNSQVGCLEYGEDPRKEAFIEEIGESNCIRVCEKSVVTYSLSGSNIDGVDWAVIGGTIQSVSGSGQEAVIEWGNSGVGAVSVEITLTNGTVITRTICIDIIKGPVADFAVTDPDNNMTFCAEVPVYFNNTSHPDGGTPLVSYFWSFGDGHYSSAFEPSHIYNNPGIYTVTLLVRNECNCVSKFSKEIEIDSPALPISCPTVVCAGAIETYTVESSECEIIWKAEGGHIISNPDSVSVQVVWDNVDGNGFGYLSAYSSCGCPVWTTVKIPVILPKGKIKGETELCAPGQYRYKLPQWPGTFFEWTLINLSSLSTNTVVIQTDQLNEAVVDALQSGEYLLKCVYHNELTGCGGIAELKLTIKKKLEITGDVEVCEGAGGAYQSSHTVTSWQLIKDDVVIDTGSGSNYDYLFTQAGLYHLVASSPDACEESTMIITVHPLSTLSGTIDGETLVCPGLPYTYSFPSGSSSYSYVWTVSGGSVQGPDTGQEVVVVFDAPVPVSGYYEVSVVQRLRNIPFCESEPLTIRVYPKEADIEIENIDNLSIFCPSSFTSFTFDFEYMSDIEDITWRIEGASSGAPPFGNIISGQGTDTIEVSWNEISGSNIGTVYLDIRFCGRNLAPIPYIVTLYRTPVPAWTDSITEVCAGSSNQFQLSFSSDITINSGQIVWDLGNGTTYSQTITAPATLFTSPLMHYPNTQDTNITRTVSVTVLEPNGCAVPAVLHKNITVKPSPRITITPGYHYGVCPDFNGSFSIALTANLQGGLTLVGDIEWYKIVGGISQQVTTGITNNGINLTVTQTEGFGTYYAQATAANGCTERSQKISIYEYCHVVSCELPFTPDVSAWAEPQTNCYTFTLGGSYSHSPDNVSWFIPPAITGLTMTSSSWTSAVFEVTAPGNYLIFYRVQYDNGSGQPCIVSRPVEIKVPFLADIRYELVCLGNGAYDVTLWDNSTHILDDDELEDLVYTFYIDNVEVQSGDSPWFNTTSLTPGTYTVGVRLSHPGYPDIITCPAETVLTLYPPADAGFSIEHDPNCTEQVVVLTIDQSPPSPGYRYEWGFQSTGFIVPDHPVTVLPALPEPTFINLVEESLPVAITLTITDPNGCVVTNMVYTDEGVSKASFDGFISGGGSFCAGEVVTLFYEPDDGLTYPDSYQWMRGNQPVSGATSATFSPLQSGSYWVILYNAGGCSDKSTPSVAVTFYPAPVVEIDGPATVCARSDFALYGTVSGSGTLEKRWLRNGVEIAGWNVNTALELTLSEDWAGVYTYRLEARDASNPGCGSWAEFTVTVLETAEVEIWFTLDGCSPYSVSLNATASIPGGTFLWSNGSNGSTVNVSEGGAYSVTFFADDGCEVTRWIYVPKDPEVYMWLFPSGCADLCREELEARITLPAPNAWFVYYDWSIDGMPDVSGLGYPPDYTIGGEGTLGLTLSNGVCGVRSNPLAITVTSCRKCTPEWGIRLVRDQREPYLLYELYGYFYNDFGTSIIVEISSPPGHGVFIPSTFSIPSATTHYFNPLIFIPNSSFGGTTTIRFLIKDKYGVVCYAESEIELPYPSELRPAAGVFLRAVPNPVTELTAFEYDLGAAHSGEIRVFDMLGIQRWEQTLKNRRGSTAFDVGILASGSYVAVLFADGKAVGQQVLIKK